MMNDNWKNFLNQQGAQIEENAVAHFGHPTNEAKAIGQNNVIADLSHIAMVKVQGEDAKNFLHQQFSNDLKPVAPNHSQLNAYCNPKGRILALFRVIVKEDGYILCLPRDILEPTIKRLRMFVMMSKVTLEDISEQVAHIGLSGPTIAARLDQLGFSVPQNNGEVAESKGITISQIPGPLPRFQLYGSVDDITPLWLALAPHTQAIGAPAWALLDIRAGQPSIHPASVESFIPQMLNLQTIDGLSFTKGCYPGQEIVARMQYLGKLKRRMYLAHTEAKVCPQEGDFLYLDKDGGERKIGEIVAAQRNENNAIELLAVLEISAAEKHNIHIGSSSGAQLQLKELPYTLNAQ